MRRVSKKRAKFNRQVKASRDEYKAQFPMCQVPNCGLKAQELHEVVRRSTTKQSLAEPGTWLHLDRDHHRAMGDYYLWSIVRQMALLSIVNPYFDRRRVNELRGRDPEAVTQDELDEALESLSTICPTCRGNGFVGARPDDYGLQVRCSTCRGTGERKL